MSLDNTNDDCITKTMSENQSDKIALSMSQLEKLDTIYADFNTLPLEIITKILKLLNLNDIISLAHVSKIWRTKYLNQNIIWKKICSDLDIQQIDYNDLHFTLDSNSVHMNAIGYTSVSDGMFGPMCRWWTIYSRYCLTIQNILKNEFPVINITRKQAEQIYCTDSYIISINRTKHSSIQALIFQSSTAPLKETYLTEFNLFTKLLQNKSNNLKIIGNNKFLVFEINSVIFVYKIKKNAFLLMYNKIIQKTDNNDNYQTNTPSNEFLKENKDTKIDMCNDKLMLVQPNKNLMFLIDLVSGKICKEMEYFDKMCLVDCIKCAEKKLMIGISIKDTHTRRIRQYVAIICHLEEEKEDIVFKVHMFGPVTNFKLTCEYIGIENKAQQTPFLTKIANLIHLFWLDCDTFSIDASSKFIYYSVNQSIFQYDLKKSRCDRFEVTQKIAIDAISSRFSLTPINDRFLLVRSIIPHSYEIFDVKEHVPVRTIQLTQGYKLSHVGKLSISFSNKKNLIVIRFI